MNKTPKYYTVDGIRLRPGLSSIGYYSALAYEPRPDDIFVAGYPKSGTTWMQQIVRLILHNGKPFSSCLDFHLSSPLIELCGAECAENMERPNAIKTHLPFYKSPYSEKAKYIYVARNPRDCCVSYFYYTRNVPSFEFSDGKFDVFFDLFLKGETPYDGYFDNLTSWYKQSGNTNILFLTYENLKRNTEKEIIKVAKFIGKNLENDQNLLNIITYRSSFDYMKENDHIFHTGKNKVFVDAYHNGIKLPQGLRELVRNLISANPTIMGNQRNFFRKGKVGSWKELFTEEQEKRLENKIKEVGKETDVMKLWNSI